jgi:uncharacterized membrane protein YkoI
MNKRRRILTAGAIALVGVGAASGVAIAASSGDDGDGNPIRGAALEKASAAALAETGGGRVTGTEAGDEESTYEVEVTLANGDQVDVQLDDAFHVVSSKNEGKEDPSDDASGADDD